MNLAISLSGLRAAVGRQDVTANNLANITTPGFKKARAFQVNVSAGGTRVASIATDFRQGPLEVADGGFHLAVRGEGFFAVDTPQGVRYTRAGIFDADGAGNLVNPEGHALLPQVQVPADANGFEITPSGEIFAVLGSGDKVQIGQIQLARFANPEGLTAEGGNLYAAGAASGGAVAGMPGEGSLGDIAFGYLEGSNVDLSTEIVDQIVNRASFSANIRAVKAQDDMMREIIDITI